MNANAWGLLKKADHNSPQITVIQNSLNGTKMKTITLKSLDGEDGNYLKSEEWNVSGIFVTTA